MWLAILLVIPFIPLAAHGEDAAYVLLETSFGEIAIELFHDDAPAHAANFVELAEAGFYDETRFHRIIPGFMIQGGDPNSRENDRGAWGVGGPGYSIDAEFNNLKHERGIVSMARSLDPNSAGSQFFIVHEDSLFLDGQYTVFGRLVTQESFDALDGIASLETDSRDAPIDAESAVLVSARPVQGTEIDDLLILGEPKRAAITETVMQEDTEYKDEELGLSFTVPAGWFVQKPQGVPEDVPLVALIGPTEGGMGPSIYFLTRPAEERTLDEYVEEIVEEASTLEGFEVFVQGETSVAGMEAVIVEVNEIFERDGVERWIKFREAAFVSGDMIHSVTYAHSQEKFDNSLAEYDLVLDSLALLDASAAPEPDPSDSGAGVELDIEAEPDPPEGGGGCLVATAAYGSELAPLVQLLREVRDDTLMVTGSGALFMGGFNTVYYSISPGIADLQRENPVFREMVRLVITPALLTLSIMTISDGSEESVLGLGLLVIALNLGIYVVAPTMTVRRLQGVITTRRRPRRAPCTPACPAL